MRDLVKQERCPWMLLMGHRLQIFPGNFHGHDSLSSADGQFDGHLMRDLNASQRRLTDATTALGLLVTQQSLSC